MIRKETPVGPGQEVDIGNLCQELDDQRNHRNLGAIVHDLALVVRELSGVSGKHAVHSHSPWPEVDDAVKAAWGLHAEPAWDIISKECGTTPAAWARALASVIGTSIDEEHIASWFEHAMLAVASGQGEALTAQVMSNTQLANEICALRNSHRALEDNLKFARDAKSLMSTDIAEALGWEVGRPWWELVQQIKIMASRWSALVEQLDEAKASCVRKQTGLEEVARSLDAAGVAGGQPPAMRVDALAKQLSVANEQLDKFQSAVADQAIQIMELRALKAIKLSTARDVLKNLDSTIQHLDNLLSAHTAIADTDFSWLKARQFASEARDWLAEAITKADK